MPIFRVKSVKIYTSLKKIYTNILVAFVTNMRYVQQRLVLGGTGSVWSGTGLFLVVLGQQKATMPLYGEKSGNLVRC